MPEFNEYAPGTPCWIDLQTSDVGEAAEFYRSLFGWDRQDLGAEMGGYGFFLKDGKMVGGVAPAMDLKAPTAWSTYVCVSDADAIAAKVKESGGTVIAEPMDVMASGRMAFFMDPTGAAIGVWQPREHKGVQLANEADTWGWSELQTRDVERAKTFYQSVFGWDTKPFENMGGYIVFENEGRGFGGLMAMAEQVPAEAPAHWLTYFGVEDADAAVDTAKNGGAAIFVPPTDIPGVGRFAVIADPQGAVFAVIKPVPPATQS